MNYDPENVEKIVLTLRTLKMNLMKIPNSMRNAEREKKEEYFSQSLIVVTRRISNPQSIKIYH